MVYSGAKAAELGRRRGGRCSGQPVGGVRVGWRWAGGGMVACSLPCSGLAVWAHSGGARHPAAGVLSTGEVSGARAIAARNAAQKGGTHVATAAAAAGGKMRAEATLTIGDLDFSSDEDEVGGGEGEGDASA